MRIIFDHQIFSVQEYGGISRLFAELYYHLKKIGVECEIPLVFSNNEYIKKDKIKKFFSNISFPGKLTLIRIINKIYTINRIKQNKFDIFHPTYFDDYFLNKIGKKPVVVTIYDLIHEKYYHDSPAVKNILKSKNHLIESAVKIISISQKTKNDLVEFYAIKPSKVKVIYPASSLNPRNVSKCKVPQKYILFVGSRKGYKNFDIILKSMKYIDKDIYLLCAGGGSLNQIELAKIKHYGISDKVLQVDVSDKQLTYCYKNAICFIFPSLYEGFGIPILESFSCSCPTLLSNIEVFKEVAGNAAIYFNPKSLKSISKSINSITENKSIRNNLIKLGTKRLKLYSWKKMSQETHNVYKSILKND